MPRSTIAIAILTICAAALAAEKPDKSPTAPKQITHRFIAVGSGQKDIVIVAADGRIEWSHPSGGVANDVALLPNGNVVWAHGSGAREVTRDKKVIWEYKAPRGREIHTAQPLGGGKVMIMLNGTPAKLLEIDRKTGKTLKELIIPTTVTRAHGQFRVVRKTKAGTYLVPHLGEKKVCEYDATGKLIWTATGFHQPYQAIRLPDGNTLVADGDGHRLAEVDRKGKVVWEIKETDLPGNTLKFVAGIQRLPNGNTIVTNWGGHSRKTRVPQIFEVTRDKKVVWEFNNWKLCRTLSNVRILDVPKATKQGQPKL